MQTLEPSPKIAAGFAPRSSSLGATGIHTHVGDPRWQLVQRIAASGSLGRSRLLAEFLLYIVDRHIRDRTDEITEQQIGILVFGRAEGYDSNEDNIVRSYARNLRKRIEEYFATEGKEEPLRLEIPRGGYAPAFSYRPVETEQSIFNSMMPNPTLTQAGNNVDASPKISSDSESGAGQARLPHALEVPGVVPSVRWAAAGRAALRKHAALLMLCAGIAVGLVSSAALPWRFLKHATASPAEAASATLWSQIFAGDRDTFVVPSDDGLIIMQRLTERPVPLASYVDGSYRANVKAAGDPSAPEILKLGGRRYTSVVDLNFVAHLAQLDEVVPARMMIRYARDLRMEDLRSGNAILIGSVEANPWIQLFQPQMNFRFSINPGSDKPSGIVNSHPRVGENAIYGTPGNNHTYGLIAYVPNLTSTGHVLIVGGLNTAGTEAATTFLLTPSLMMPALQRARATQGGLQPFELLIGAGNVATNASTPQVILERIGAP
jgi:hypothetical protein